MKFLLSLNIIGLLFCSYLQGNQLVNLTLARQAVEHYYESGKFAQEVQYVLDQAWLALKDIHVQKMSAIIIDIDETALLNYDYFKIKSFNKGTETEFSYWKSLGHCYALKPMLNFYQKLVNKNFKIMFISCRSIEIYNQTAENLKKEGYHTFERILLRTPEDMNIPFYAYKQQQRYALANEGYDIIACIGDQWSDLEGEHTGIKIKLPNYILYE